MMRLMLLMRGQVQLAHVAAAAEAELVIVDAASVVIQTLAVRSRHAAVHRAAGRGRRRREVGRGAGGGGGNATSRGCSCRGTSAGSAAQPTARGYRRHRGQSTAGGTQHGGGCL